MTDRYIKVVFTIIALSLIWLGVKDTPLEPVVSAQNQGWDAPFEDWDGGGPHSSDQERALLRWSLLGLFSS